MCYGNSNQQSTPGSVQNFANTSNYQGQVAGVPKNSMLPNNLMMQNENFNKLNYQNKNNPSVLFGESSPANGSAKMIK